jgi:DNA-binding NarL/FixJ family response regulator/DMSO/TMAO reductase YedYZ heme-binding membrane subunit
MTSNDVVESRQPIVAEPSSKDSSLLSTTQDVSQDFSEQKIRVLIVDDLRLVCEGLQAIFDEVQDIDIVGFALNGKEAIKQVSKVKPDVVILDLLMPGMGGLETTKKISQQYPDVKILILSSFDDDSIVSEIIAAGGNGYVFKNMVISELAIAIRSVHNGSYHFAAGLLDTLVKTTDQPSISNALNLTSDTVSAIDSPVVAAQPQAIQAIQFTQVTQVTQATSATSTTSATQVNQPKQPKLERPLLPYGDWALAVAAVIVFSQINVIGSHLGHVGLFLLMLALIARPLKGWWDAPWKYRRGIDVIAFAAVLAHVIYVTRDSLEGNLATIGLMSTQHKWGMWIGIASLGIMTLVAMTSFRFLQRKLGNAGRHIHLLSVPVMALAVLHTILVGPHYLMADAQVEAIDYFRSFCIIAIGLLIWLLRQRIVWSKLKLNNLDNTVKKQIKLTRI